MTSLLSTSIAIEDERLMFTIKDTNIVFGLCKFTDSWFVGHSLNRIVDNLNTLKDAEAAAYEYWMQMDRVGCNG